MTFFLLLILPGLAFVVFVVAVAVKKGRREIDAAERRGSKENQDRPGPSGS